MASQNRNFHPTGARWWRSRFRGNSFALRNSDRHEVTSSIIIEQLRMSTSCLPTKRHGNKKRHLRCLFWSGCLAVGCSQLNGILQSRDNNAVIKTSNN